jgi:hypothetical protein
LFTPVALRDFVQEFGMRTVNSRASLGYFVCCSAVIVGCSDTGITLPNNGVASAGSATSNAGSSSSGGSSSIAGAGVGTETAGGSGAGATTNTGSSAATGGDAALAGSGSSAGSGSGGVVGVQRPKGQLPNIARDPANVDVPRDQWRKDIVSPSMLSRHHINQPTVLNGYLNINGNEEFWFWDITDPTKPKQMTEYLTPNRDPRGGGKGEGEAESHCVSYGRYGDKFYEVTTGGHGVDIWDVTDQTSVKHVSQIKLEGIDYGDYTAAVWGLSWQGNYIYVGGTDTGLHILDAHDPLHVTVAKQLPTSKFGSVSAGPLDAIGNVLVITTPKESAGIATMDISDPLNPVYMHSIRPTEKSYIGQFYRHYVFLQTPLRAWDVLTDPYNIGKADVPLGLVDSPNSEYLSFGDNNLFLGRLRPDGGATVYDVTDPSKGIVEKSNVWGRLDIKVNDDQFSLMIGNLLVLADDQEPYAGTVITQWAAAPDTTPPFVDYVSPTDKSTGQSVKSRIGLSFTDNIELATVNAASFIVREVGGPPLKGTWGSRMGVVNFSPNEDLKPATTYEIVLPKGGVADLVQNGIAEEFKSTFTTK